MDEDAYNPNIAHPVEKCLLFNRLDESNKEIVKKIETLAEKKLKIVDEVLTHYNSHDIKHAQRTIGHLCEILRVTNVLSDVKPMESLILICAGLLHDVGMGPLGPEEDMLFKNDELRRRRDEVPKIDHKVIDSWRHDHHIRALKWIIESKGTALDELKPRIRRAIAEIAYSHKEISILHYDYFEGKPRYAFFGACLRLADEMDITPSRIEERFENPRESFKIALQRENMEESNSQLTEWLKVFVDKNWKLSITEGKRTLLLESKIWNDELTLRTLSALEELVDKIEETIESTKDVPWSTKTTHEWLLPTNLDVNFRVRGSVEQTSHKLGADYDHIWDYLVERLYDPHQREYVSIREAVSNAIDACMLLHDSIRKSAKVIVTDNKAFITIEDNGIGLSKDIIENYLKVLGSSYYESSRYKGWLNKMGMKPPSVIGQFGIGTFSYLLISNAYELHTKTEDGPSYKVRFSKKFGVTLPGRKKKRGTIVSIPCPLERRGQSWKTSDGLETILSQLFIKPKIPIFFRPYEGKKKIIGFYPNGKVRYPDSKNSYYKFEEIATVGNVDVGISIESENRAVLRKGMTNESLLEFITTVNGYYYDSKYYPRGIYPALLYSGMRIEGLNPNSCPITRALTSITSIGPPIRSTGKGLAWIDLKKGSVSVSLTKSSIEQADVLLEHIEKLETISKKYLDLLFKSTHVDEMLKFRTRYQLARNLAYLSNTTRVETGTIRSRSTQPLLFLFDEASEVYLEHLQDDRFLIENLIEGWFCINLQENRFQSLIQEMDENKREFYYLDFKRIKQKRMKSSKVIFEKLKSKPIHLLLPYPGKILENVMKYYFSSNKYNIIMDSMILPFLDTPTDVQPFNYPRFESNHNRTELWDQMPSETVKKIMNYYHQFIAFGGRGILGADILSIIVDFIGQTILGRAHLDNSILHYKIEAWMRKMAIIYGIEESICSSLAAITLGHTGEDVSKFSRYIKDSVRTIVDLLNLS